jgi:hypothetical protein
LAESGNVEGSKSGKEYTRQAAPTHDKLQPLGCVDPGSRLTMPRAPEDEG